ncbi:MAG TPA: hypothetical protein PLV83_04190 [Bacilli bacterium]|nr:hypothetical protein [Bacilli bacterium]
MESIETKLFHGINLGNYSEYIGVTDSIDIFEEILKTRKILTRDDLAELNPEIYSILSMYHIQSNNEVCLAIHPKNPNKNIESNMYEDAFYDFIRNNISFVFNENILKNRAYRRHGMPNEIEVTGSIELDENLEAIGCYDAIENVIRLALQNTLTHRTRFQLIHLDSSSYVRVKRSQYYNIKEVLKKYEYDIPIIDPLYGNIINDNIEEDIEKIEKVKKLVK